MANTESPKEMKESLNTEIEKKLWESVDRLKILMWGVSSGLSSERIEEALRKIEIWQGSIEEYERYKKCAYEFIQPPEDTERKHRFVDNKYGVKQYTYFYNNLEDNGYYATVDFEKSLEEGVEAFVNFKVKSEIKDDGNIHHYHGLPVRKAKSKGLRNLMLRYFY